MAGEGAAYEEVWVDEVSGWAVAPSLAAANVAATGAAAILNLGGDDALMETGTCLHLTFDLTSRTTAELGLQLKPFTATLKDAVDSLIDHKLVVATAA